jgi:hypothetical protein
MVTTVSVAFVHHGEPLDHLEKALPVAVGVECAWARETDVVGSQQRKRRLGMAQHALAQEELAPTATCLRVGVRFVVERLLGACPGVQQTAAPVQCLSAMGLEDPPPGSHGSAEGRRLL